MSGIYIPGMAMPKNCSHCKFCFGANNICPFLREYAKNDGRHDGCPLIPVPDHGRLVEADAVVEQIDEWIDAVGYATVGKGLSYYGELLGCVDDAPTIIPADRKDGAE